MNRKRIIIASILIVLVVSAVIFWNYLQKGTLEISAPSQTPNNSNVLVEVRQATKPGMDIELKPGQTKRVRLSPGTVRVNGAAGDIKSVDIVVVERRKTTKLTTPSGQQHEIALIGLNARFCPVVLPDKVFSYNCQSDGPVIKHLPGRTTTIFGGQLFSLLQPLGSDLVGFYANNLSSLQYLNLHNETIEPVSLPGEIQTKMSTDTPEIITSDQPDDKRLILFFPLSNEIYLFKDVADQQPVEISLGEGVRADEDGRILVLSFVGEEVIVYAGSDSHTHDGEEHREDFEEPELPSYLFEYNNSGQLINTVTLGDGFDAEGLYKIADGYYLADNRNSFEFYYLEQGRLTPVFSLGDVTDWINYTGKTLVVSDRSLYLFTPTTGGKFTLSSVFTSGELPVSEVFSSVRGTIFTGFAGSSSSAPLNIYQLLDTIAQPGASLPGISTATQVNVVGIDSLLTLGVTSEQVNTLRETLRDFAQTLPGAFEQITVIGAEAMPRDRNSASTTEVVMFDVFIDDLFYKAKMEYTNLTTIRLYLHDINSVPVYDSQSVSD